MISQIRSKESKQYVGKKFLIFYRRGKCVLMSLRIFSEPVNDNLKMFYLLILFVKETRFKRLL